MHTYISCVLQLYDSVVLALMTQFKAKKTHVYAFFYSEGQNTYGAKFANGIAVVCFNGNWTIVKQGSEKERERKKEMTAVEEKREGKNIQSQKTINDANAVQFSLRSSVCRYLFLTYLRTKTKQHNNSSNNNNVVYAHTRQKTTTFRNKQEKRGKHLLLLLFLLLSLSVWQWVFGYLLWEKGKVTHSQRFPPPSPLRTTTHSTFTCTHFFVRLILFSEERRCCCVVFLHFSV